MQTTPTKPASGFPFRHLARHAGYTAVFNLMCAIIVTALTGMPHEFFQNVVYSMCIGMIALVVIDGARLALWRPPQRVNWPVFVVIIVLAVPVAQYSGVAAGNLLLGYRMPDLGKFMSGSMNSMLVFTLMATSAAMLFLIGRERIVRAEATIAEEKARVESVERQAVQTQLRLLQAQIEPHMLFNTLANLQGLIAIDPDRAQEMLDHLIQYLRATLSTSRAETTTLAQEFALLDAYLGLIAVRMGERMRYTLDLPEGLKDAPLPPMLLQPLVENAVVHGLEPKIDGGHVHISAAHSRGMLELLVADSGLGLHAAPATSGTGLGVANTRERLHAVYGDAAALTLEPNTPCGALVRLTLPLPAP